MKPLAPGMALITLVAGTASERVAAAAEEPSLVPFVIPADPAADSLVAMPPGPPITSQSDRVVARDGRFWRGRQ